MNLTALEFLKLNLPAILIFVVVAICICVLINLPSPVRDMNAEVTSKPLPERIDGKNDRPPLTETFTAETVPITAAAIAGADITRSSSNGLVLSAPETEMILRIDRPYIQFDGAVVVRVTDEEWELLLAAYSDKVVTPGPYPGGPTLMFFGPVNKGGNK